MKADKSLEQFFLDLNTLIERLRIEGLSAAAEELQQGKACLNGLTDGWGLLLESMQKVASQQGTSMRPTLAGVLQEMKVIVQNLIDRRLRG
jgi:hypothetical protein